MNAQQQAVLAARGDLQEAGRARHGDRPPVGVTVDRLDPRHQTGGEEGPHRVPVIAGHDRQAQGKPAVGGEPVGAVPAIAQVGRRRAEHVLHGPVELAQAAEPGGESDVHHGEVGVVEEPPGEVRAPGPGQLIRAHPQMPEEQPAKMPR